MQEGADELVVRQAGARANRSKSTYLPVVDDGLVPPHAGIELSAHGGGRHKHCGNHEDQHRFGDRLGRRVEPGARRGRVPELACGAPQP